MINPILINLRILSYLSCTHSDILSHNIHFLFGRIDDILRSAKQTTTQFIVCCDLKSRKRTNRYSCSQSKSSQNFILHLDLLDQLESFRQEFERALPHP